MDDCCFFNIPTQIETFKDFPLGYDYEGKEESSVKRKTKEAKNLSLIGKHTSHLFLFAIEESGSGPPKDTMKLSNDDTRDVCPKGTAAFLRAVQRYLPMSFSGMETTGEYAKRRKLPKELVSTEHVENDSFVGREEMETNTKICKVAVNPLLIFLHVDQGSFADGRYTPFGNPAVNSRSIYKENVEVLSKKLAEGENVIKGEDFAIVPYKALIGNMLWKNVPKQLHLLYRCTLDRDPSSSHTIIGKEAITADVGCISEHFLVSPITISVMGALL